jgi:hypothetical protein
MHKSKGLRDNAVGKGKFGVSYSKERIVNIKNDNA